MTSADDTVKRIALWVGAFLAVATMLGMVNKVFIADPIVQAVADERVARIAADEALTYKLGALTDKLAEIAERQAMFTGAVTAVPGSAEWIRAERYLRRNIGRVPMR